MTSSINPTWLVVAVTVTMLTVTVPTAAMHNSAGGDVAIAQPDEVDSDGALVPDIPESSPHIQEFHENSPMGQEVQPRLQPEDQRGERYAPGDRHADDTDCTTAQEFTGTEQEFREQVATSDDLCYVGFMDAQREMFLYFSLLINPLTIDLLYPANPAQEDEYCTGQSNPDQHAGPSVDDGGPVDSTIASANRSAMDDECNGIGHKQGIPGDVKIDTDLVEAPLDGRAFPTDGVAQTTDTDPGSGSRTLPGFTTPYIFLFGQPNPEVIAEEAGVTVDQVDEQIIDEHRILAGEGPFSGDIAQGSAPVTDLSGACGDRTEDCVLLTPDDVKAFDPYPETGQGDEEQPRVCEFAPQFGTVNPDGRAAGLCGVFGNVMNTFKRSTTEGGLGVDGAPPTWVSTLPGWYQGVIYITAPNTHPEAGHVRSTVDDYQDEEKETRPGYLYYYAVNPKVPAGDDPTWCIRPNMESTGTGAGDVSETDDPGFFGPYRADAIDADVYPVAYLNAANDVRDDTHDTVYNNYNDTLNTLANAQDVVLDAVSDAGNQSPEAVNETVDRAIQAFNEHNSRANPFAPGWSADKGYNQLNGTQEDFQQSFDGLACNGQGVPEFQKDTTIYGGLVFDAEVDQQTVAIKDPTVLGDIAGVPAPQNDDEAKRGVWQTDAYSFDGNILGVSDTNRDDDFDSCATPDGQNDPSEDFCPWQALWDAYNPNCTTFAGLSCLAQLDRAGYAVNESHLYDTGEEEYLFPEDSADASDIQADNPNAEFHDESEHGVGLYFKLEITGPFVLVDNEQDLQEAEDRTTVVGDEAVTARHCVVGTSVGFNKHLPSIVESELGLGDALTGSASPMQATAEELCDTGPDGDVVVVTHAFDDQSGTNRGSFESAVSFVKLAPTPDAVVDESGLGEGDKLCLGGVWSVKDLRTAPTDDTEGSLDFTSGSGDYPHHYGECLDFGTGDDAQNSAGAPGAN